jgi:hypothetical protein
MAKTKSKRQRLPQDLVAFQLSAADSGFWVLIRSSRSVHYKIEYFALGAAGYQRKGEVDGRTDGLHFRKFIDLGFTVMIVGVTDAEFSIGTLAKKGWSHLPGVPPSDVQFEPIRPTSLVPRGGEKTKMFIGKKRGGGKDAGSYGGAYGFYGGGYMYGPMSLDAPVNKESSPKQERKRHKSRRSRRKH